MADYYNNNASYAGVYTEKEKAWLTILRYGGFLLFGAGIYGFVSGRLPVAANAQHAAADATANSIKSTAAPAGGPRVPRH